MKCTTMINRLFALKNVPIITYIKLILITTKIIKGYVCLLYDDLVKIRHEQKCLNKYWVAFLFNLPQ